MLKMDDRRGGENEKKENKNKSKEHTGSIWELGQGERMIKVDPPGAELSGPRPQRSSPGATRVGASPRSLPPPPPLSSRPICSGAPLVLSMPRPPRSVIDSCRLIFFIRSMATWTEDMNRNGDHISIFLTITGP